MIPILKTRFMLIRKSWLSLSFWLLLPIILTIGLIYIANLVQDDARIPVGIVVEEESPLVEKLLTELKGSPLLQVVETTESEAKRLVESHELDSAFVIKKGYENNIRNGKRNRLLIGYESDLSFAYTVTRETILSLIQKDSGRAKTVQTVNALMNDNVLLANWSEYEIINKVLETEADQNLLNSKFLFLGENTAETSETQSLFGNPWALWSLFSFLSMLLIFDWVIKEKQSSTLPRLQFSRISIKYYFLLNMLVYLSLFLTLDIITMILFEYLYDTGIGADLLFRLVSFRLTAVAIAFLLALCFRKLTVYYAISFISLLFIAITSGVIIPVEGISNQFQWLEILHPIRPFLIGEAWSPLLIIFIGFIALWFVKGEKRHA